MRGELAPTRNGELAPTCHFTSSHRNQKNTKRYRKTNKIFGFSTFFYLRKPLLDFSCRDCNGRNIKNYWEIKSYANTRFSLLMFY